MRLLHFGNICNNAYKMVTFLRRKGFEADLLLDGKEFVSSFPEWEDGELDPIDIRQAIITHEELVRRLRAPFDEPEWIHHINGNLDIGLFYIKRASYVLRAALFCHRYDFIHAWTTKPIIAYLSGKPYIAHVTGADLAVVAFEKGLKGFMMRRAYRNARKVIYEMWQRKNVERLGLKNFTYIPFPVDTDKFKPRSDERLREDILEKTGWEKIFFVISRQDWDTLTGKASDRLWRAFAKYAKEDRGCGVVATNWGFDLEKSKQLIKKLGIEKKVTWVDFMPKMLLLRYLNASDIIIDHFSFGGFGVATMEAMACAKPVMIHLGPESLSHYKEPPPRLEAEFEPEILAAFRASEDKKRMKALGQSARSWIIKHHGWRTITDRYIEMYEVLDIG